jgi:hypothetical protein
MKVVMRFAAAPSLALNVAVLTPICIGLALNVDWAGSAYGPAAPARGILFSVYLAILAVSVWQLFRPRRETIRALLLVQVIYKVTTPFTVGTQMNPVVISNLIIALLHTATLVMIARSSRREPSPS